MKFDVAMYMPFVKAGITLVIGFIVAKFVSIAMVRAFKKRSTEHQQMVLKRVVFYILLALFVIMSLQQMNFQLSALLGAAGILTLAIGFASQTSVSNVISGLFLLLEGSFHVGDALKVNGDIGVVMSIDLLSVKLRTYDNRLVRVPNEHLIKTQFINVTHFPIRRFDLIVGVAYKEDLIKVQEVLFELAAKNELILSDPKPLFFITGFGASSVDLQFSAWARREDYIRMKNSLHQDIKTAFDANNIEIPYPHLVIEQ